jgi:hypothetical protein
MSGYTDDASLRDAAEAARIRFVAKPFTPEQLIGAIESALADAASTG